MAEKWEKTKQIVLSYFTLTSHFFSEFRLVHFIIICVCYRDNIWQYAIADALVETKSSLTSEKNAGVIKNYSSRRRW